MLGNLSKGSKQRLEAIGRLVATHDDTDKRLARIAPLPPLRIGGGMAIATLEVFVDYALRAVALAGWIRR